ncbi:MAG: phage protease [Verrucomicrobiota bacterium]|nr:phage protease [Verrucomicrobiota bacterium]
MNLSNSSFDLLQSDWLQLSPYGDFPHALGLQRITQPAMEQLVARFDALLSRLARRFSGAPIYIGHPDLPALAGNYPDRRAYGWIMKLQARADGLYGQVKWSDPGAQLLRNGHYKFVSPCWEAEEIARENGKPVYRPVSLISVGLTNAPNLPVLPLSNEQSPAPDSHSRRALIENATREGRLTPAQELLALQNTAAPLSLPPLPVINLQSRTRQLGARYCQQLNRLGRHARIQELIHQRMQSGSSYDQAWQSLKTTHPELFR